MKTDLKKIVMCIFFGAFVLLSCTKRTTPIQKLGGIGDPCTGDFSCNENLVCAYSKTCQDSGKRQNGSVPIGGACAEDKECAWGLTCCSSSLSQMTGCTVQTCIPAGEEGDSCASTGDCKLGFVCGKDKHCQPDGVGKEGAPCTTIRDCAYKLVCSGEGTCAKPGTGTSGSPCDGPEDCMENFVCAGDGTCVDPGAPDSSSHGIGDVGDECSGKTDCLATLTCFIDGTCQPVQYWPGAYCPPSEPSENFKIYFEIPSLPMEGETDFYRLPFPNDIRIKNGRVALDGHPLPDTSIGKQIVKSWFDAVENSATGFSTIPTVFMRFSKSPDFSTVRLASSCQSCNVPAESPPECPSGCAQWLFRNFYIVNITPPSDSSDPNYMGYGEGVSFGVGITTGRGKYICPNFIFLRPAENSPLRPGATYAVIVTDTANPANGIRAASSEGGVPLVKDDDFAKLIEGLTGGDCAGAAGGDPDIESACMLPGYRYLKNYLDDTSILDYDPNWREHIKAAAVFTVMKPERTFSKVRDKIYNCTGSDCSYLPQVVPESVAQNTDMGGSGFTTYDFFLKMPVFQRGTPPFENPPEGGVETGSSDEPILVQTDENYSKSPASISIPNSGEVPSQGWPVVIFMPDIASSDEDMRHLFVRNGVAELLSSVSVEIGDPPQEQTARFAVISFDPIMHSTRKGGSSAPSSNLYFNLQNPYAVAGNMFQSAAEGYQILRFIKYIHDSFVAGNEPQGFEGINLDPENVFLLAHGEGARSALIFTSFEPAIKALALSQTGGPIISNLIQRKEPIEFLDIFRVILGEKSPDAITPAHPVLSIMQMVFDPVCPVNYAGMVIRKPPQIGTNPDDTPVYGGPHHTYMVAVRDDAWTPESSLMNIIGLLGIAQFDNDPRNCVCYSSCDTTDEAGYHAGPCTIDGVDQFDSDVRGNLSRGAVTGIFTIVTGSHEEMFDENLTKDQFSKFFASSFLDTSGIPTIFAP